MINQIINDIKAYILPFIPGVTILTEQDPNKSPFVSIWTADTDIEDAFEVIYTNWIIREPKANLGELSRTINKALLNFQQVSKTDYTIFGLSIPQGIKKLNYSTDNKDTEFLLTVKVYYNAN